MTRSFADTARCLSRVASAELGWTPGTFWTATPAELADLLMPVEAVAPLSALELKSLLERDNAD